MLIHGNRFPFSSCFARGIDLLALIRRQVDPKLIARAEDKYGEESASALIHQKGERGEEGLSLIDGGGKGRLSAHLFSALCRFMLTETHAARDAVSERGVPFYERNSGRFITLGKG
jgi:hypothetical protein